MSNTIQNAIQVALHGLADRQRTTSDNLANVETPGYLAKRTNFESSLQAALNGQSGVNLNPTHSVSMDETRTDGNNVNLDNETVTATDTELRYQAMIEAMNVQFRTLKTAIG